MSRMHYGDQDLTNITVEELHALWPDVCVSVMPGFPILFAQLLLLVAIFADPDPDEAKLMTRLLLRVMHDPSMEIHPVVSEEDIVEALIRPEKKEIIH